MTNFTAGATDTIPRFIYRNLRLPHNRPIVNVVALGVILVMFIPVYVAQRMAGGGDVTATAAKAEAAEVDGSLEVLAPRTGRVPGPCWSSVLPGSPRRRSSSNCARAAICCENSAAWIPWNRPSSQPTSWAWATRISASVGHALHRRRERGELLLQVGRQHVLELADRALVDLTEPDAAGLVERRLTRVLQQLPDHASRCEAASRVG